VTGTADIISAMTAGQRFHFITLRYNVLTSTLLVKDHLLQWLKEKAFSFITLHHVPVCSIKSNDSSYWCHCYDVNCLIVAYNILFLEWLACVFTCIRLDTMRSAWVLIIYDCGFEFILLSLRRMLKIGASMCVSWRFDCVTCPMRLTW